MSIMVGQIIVHAAILSLILYLVARREANYGFQKVVMVIAGISGGSFAIQALLGDRLGAWIYIPVIAFVSFMLVTLCLISPMKSVAVILVYTGLAVGANYLAQPLLAKLSSETAGETNEVQRTAGPALTTNTAGAPDRLATQPLQTVAAAGVASNAAVAPSRLVPTVLPEATTEWQAARKQLSVTGIMRKGTTYVATINGRLVEPGETVTADYAGKRFRWRIAAISLAGVTPEPLEAEPLKRKR